MVTQGVSNGSGTCWLLQSPQEPGSWPRRRARIDPQRAHTRIPRAPAAASGFTHSFGGGGQAAPGHVGRPLRRRARGVAPLSHEVAFAFSSISQEPQTMRHFPRASRMELYVRNQIRGLSFVGWALLLMCMTMTGLFGWSLGQTLVQKVTNSAGLALIDLAGAFTIKACGTNIAYRTWVGAFWASVGAVMCAGITFTSVLGFQSDSRETRVATRERAAQIADQFIKFSETTITKATSGASKAKSGPNPSLITSSIETLGQAVTKQVEMLKDGTLAIEPDGQATTLARITGLTKEQARSWTTTAFTAGLLFVQYVCQWLVGFMRHRVEPVVSPRAASGYSDDGEAQFGQFGKFGTKLSKEDARREVIRMLATEISFPSNLELAGRWGVSATTVCHWLQAFRAEGHRIPPSPRGGRVGQRGKH
jgi:hypothetical protein